MIPFDHHVMLSCVFSSVLSLTMPAVAEDHRLEVLEDKLETVHEKMERYEERYEEPPEELIEIEEKLLAEIEKIEAFHEHDEEHDEAHERRVEEEVEGLLKELEELSHEIEEKRGEDEPAPPEMIGEYEHILRELRGMLKDEEYLRPLVALRWMQAFSPLHVERLKRARRENPEHFEVVLEDVLPHLFEMQHLRLAHPKRYDLERESFRLNGECENLAERVRRVGPEEQEAIARELRDRLGELFRIRLEIREMEIRRLEEELSELRRHVKQMREDAEGMVERRLQRMIGEGEHW